MHEAAATPAWVLIAYLVSGVCFILALRGLSSPESSRRGNMAGMIGMAIAVVTTLAIHEVAILFTGGEIELLRRARHADIAVILHVARRTRRAPLGRRRGSTRETDRRAGIAGRIRGRIAGFPA